jgi:hypothetical protein
VNTTLNMSPRLQALHQGFRCRVASPPVGELAGRAAKLPAEQIEDLAAEALWCAAQFPETQVWETRPQCTTP